MFESESNHFYLFFFNIFLLLWASDCYVLIYLSIFSFGRHRLTREQMILFSIFEEIFLFFFYFCHILFFWKKIFRGSDLPKWDTDFPLWEAMQMRCVSNGFPAKQLFSSITWPQFLRTPNCNHLKKYHHQRRSLSVTASNGFFFWNFPISNPIKRFPAVSFRPTHVSPLHIVHWQIGSIVGLWITERSYNERRAVRWHLGCLNRGVIVS